MDTPENLLHLLRTWGRLSAGEVASRLGISRPTLMRAVRTLGPQVVSLGLGRRTAYAARRSLRGHLAALPVYRIDESGQAHEVAALAPLHPTGCALTWREASPWPLDADMEDGWFDGLPYLLDDMRPQGFLGRHFARAHAHMLQVGPDPQRWSEDDALHALSLLGQDSVGCYVVGEPALRAWLARASDEPQPLTDGQLRTAYPQLADAALSEGEVGSSAGGEFPKFTALRQVDGQLRHVLVKFSGADNSPGTQRWTDLLVCEHLAGQVIADHLQLPSATTRLLQAGGRTFLEIDRFDRHGFRGRSPVCSWAALNGGLLGLPSHAWVLGAQALQTRGWLAGDTASAIARLWHFGHLIANTDMHDGNLAFRPGASISPTSARRPLLSLAPIYDMLPMRYAPPRAAEVLTPAFTPQRPLPSEAGPWREALPAAQAFWGMAAQDKRISAGFRRVCGANEKVLGQIHKSE